MLNSPLLSIDEDWIGTLPSGWETSKLKYLVSWNTTVLAEDTDPDLEFTYIEISDVSLTGGVQLNGPISFRDAPSRARRVLQSQDILISTVRTYLRAISQVPDLPNLIGSTGFCVLKADLKSIDSRYLYYSVVSDWFVERVISESKGVSYPAINPTELVELSVPLPPLKEQQLISRYLDKKTAQIDSLIEKIEKKIELLKEQRTSLINQCVTKGLDPNVEMKDSGVEWIGKIPKHWERTRLKYVASSPAQYGLNIESDSYVDEGIRFLRITDINADSTLDGDGGVYLPTTLVPGEYYLKTNDILFSRSGATVGKSTRIDSDNKEMAFAGYLIRFGFENSLVSRFIKWITESDFYWKWIQLQVIQSTIQNVNGEKYSNYIFFLPPESEIDDINDRLDRTTTLLDRMLAKYGEKIMLLLEYRQSLISSVVTGKIRITEDMV